MSKIEEVLWKAIKDIENGDVAFITEDPINGYLEGRNKKLTKMNVSQQSAKYTENGKAITRPTIDSLKPISEYITNKKDLEKNNTDALLKEIELLKNKNKELQETIIQVKEYADGVAFENFKLTEKINHKKNCN